MRAIFFQRAATATDGACAIQADDQTASQTLAILQQIAADLGMQPYTPPVATPHTLEEELSRWHNWANACSRFEQYQDALVRSDRAIELAPNNPSVLLVRGNILAGLKQEEAALKLYQQALSLTPVSDLASLKTIYNQIGLSLSHAARYTEADAAYVQALAAMPDAANTWGNRALNEWKQAEVYARAGRTTEAQHHIEFGMTYGERALHLNPNLGPVREILTDLLELRQLIEILDNH